MRTAFLALAAAVLVGLVALALAVAWPRPDPVVDATVLPAVPAAPAALDAWLADGERRFDDLRPGTQKTVLWANPAAPARTPVALVYLHGFSATRQETAPLTETAGAALGANVYLARLAGHGRTGEAMAAATLDQWVADGMEALAIGHTIGEKVVVIGTSTGATLATWLAAQRAPVDGLVLISPNFGPRAPGAGLLTMLGRETVAPLLAGDERSWEPRNADQARYWTTRYPTPALYPMADLVQITQRADLSAISAPVLAITSPKDDVVKSELVPGVLAACAGTVDHIVIEHPVEGGSHVLAGRILAPDQTAPLADAIAAFARGL